MNISVVNTLLKLPDGVKKAIDFARTTQDPVLWSIIHDESERRAV